MTLYRFQDCTRSAYKENNVDLNIILEKVVEDFRKQSGHPLIMINCLDYQLVNGYPLLLTLLFHHLMDNAIKFRKRDRSYSECYL